MRKANRWPCLIRNGHFVTLHLGRSLRFNSLEGIEEPLVNLTRVLGLRSSLRVVAGGYDPSVVPEAYTEDSGSRVDFIVRGEGESTFHELLCTVEMESCYERILGLSVSLKFYELPELKVCVRLNYRRLSIDNQCQTTTSYAPSQHAILSPSSGAHPASVNPGQEK